MQKLRVALIGYGYWGEKLFKALQSSRSIKVIAVCGKNQRVINELKSTGSGIKLITNNYRDVTSNKNIDAVVIATPADTHYQIAMVSLQSGKHVLLEKPMTQKITHARKLYKFADKKKLILMIDHTYLYAPEIRATKQIINSGILGDIRFIESTRVGPEQYKNDSDVIWDFGPHDISILYYLLGIPTKISAVNFCHLNRNRIDVSSLYFKFAKKCKAHVYLSWLSPTKIRKMLVVGTKKSLLVEQPGIAGKVRVYSNSRYFRESNHEDAYGPGVKNMRRLSGLYYSEPLRNVCHEFVQCIQANTQPLSNGRMGWEIVNIIEAAHKLKPVIWEKN